MAEITVTNNQQASRWEAYDGEQLVGCADYVLTDETAIFTHTEVPSEFEGMGIAGQLVRTSLDDARSAGHKVVPQCSFYADWIIKHPEYNDLAQSETAAPPQL